MAKKRVPKRWIRGKVDELAVEKGCYFDQSAGELVCDFIETYCRQSKGKWADDPISLLSWQRDFIMRLFGWKKADGRRRFTNSYVEIPKKNGKSTLISAVAVACCVLDEEGAPEIHLNAVDRDQASIVFDEAAKMIQASPTLRKRFDVVDSRKRILDKKNDGVIRANSAESQKLDGVNASVVIFDELHRLKTRDQWDIFQYASASREQPLRIVITTAGEDESGPWFEQRTKSLDVNKGTDEDIEHLGIVYAVEEGDDLDDEATWVKVNPSLGHTIRMDTFRKDYEDAKTTPIKWALFCRLRLGKIVKGAAAYLPLDVWDRCGAAVLKPHMPLYLGLDLSTNDDLTALAMMSGDESSGYDLRMRFWLPDEDIVELEKSSRILYRAYEEAGHIDLIPGPVIDYDVIEDAILEIAAEREVAMILADPWNAYKLCLKLRDKHALPVEFLRQGFGSLSNPTKEFLRIAKAGKLRTDGNPIMRACVGNAVVEMDAAGNIKLTKRRSRGKIDGAAAAINATAGVFSGAEYEGESVYEKRGVLIF
jgi:phage terminase large subunit-like protein